MKEKIVNNYLHYKENDFLADPLFQEWVKDPNDDINQYWQQIMNAFPQKKTEIENAYLYLQSISFKEEYPTNEEVNASLEKHLLSIQDQLNADSESVVKTNRLWRNVMKIAAVFGGVVLITIGYLFFSGKLGGPKNHVVKTDFGEIKKVTLPDGSIVELNANSEIKFSNDWGQNEKREIWLSGEAFFNVKHFNNDTTNIQPHETFLVHTKHLTVTVLGTRFDVRQRREKTEVVLQSGKIALSFPTAVIEDIILKPGEMISFNNTGKKIEKHTTSPEHYSAWKEQKLILRNPSVNEILIYLEDNFGKKIVLADSATGSKMISGPILLSSLEDALFVLSSILNTEVIKKDSQTIILQPR